MPLFAAGHNQPGHRRDYRGEGTLVTCDWRRARDHLVEDLRDAADAIQTWADPHDCDDIPCPTYGDDCPDNLAADLRMAAEEAAALRPHGKPRSPGMPGGWQTWAATVPPAATRWPSVAGPSSTSGRRTAAPATSNSTTNPRVPKGAASLWGARARTPPCRIRA